MLVRLKKRGRGAGESALAAARAYVRDGHRDWIEFLREQNGAVPDANILEVSPDNAIGISRFWDIDEIRRERAVLADRLPPGLLAIADVEGGNFLCLDVADGHSVHFFDHELEETTAIAGSFSAFLERLRPFDPSTVTLEPGKVISKWVDPDFLAQLEQDGDDD